MADKIRDLADQVKRLQEQACKAHDASQMDDDETPGLEEVSGNLRLARNFLTVADKQLGDMQRPEKPAKAPPKPKETAPSQGRESTVTPSGMRPGPGQN